MKNQYYKYIKQLGESGFAFVIAVFIPQKEKTIIKIIKKREKKKNTWTVEDQLWSTLHHRCISPVLEIKEMKNPAVKLYVTPYVG